MDADLGAAGGRAIHQDPLLAAVAARTGVGGAVVGVQGAGAEVCGGHRLADQMCFPNPRALCMGKDDADGDAGQPELVHQRVHVGRRQLRGRAIVVYDLLRSAAAID